ncbi:MAG: alpha/beta hydrolase domain-containing protein [Acidimicrobiia bacterium]
MTAPPFPRLVVPPVGNGRIQDAFPMFAGGGGTITTAPSEEPAYVERELLVTGTANVYRYGASTDELVVADTDREYTTRLILRHPADLAACSGTLVLEIAHPEIGVGPLWPWAGPYLRAAGDAHAIVTTRRNNQAYGTTTPISNLLDFDPERYAAIDFEEGGLSWDIVAQVAALLRSDDESNPLAATGITQVVCGGYSGAGAYTLMYLKNFHDRWRRPDGSPLMDAYFVGEPSWYQQISTLDDRLPSDQGVPADLDVPAISLYTGPQLWMDHAIGRGTDRVRPDRDGDRRGYRTYEIAGGAHANGPGCGLPASDLRLDHVFRLCLDHLKHWSAGDRVAPHGDRVAVDDSLVAEGRSPRPQRDEHGNPLGGLRSTFVDVPRARYRVCRETNSGVMEPFSEATMVELYGTSAAYVDAVRARAASLVAEGWLLASDADEVIAMAEAVEGFGE